LEKRLDSHWGQVICGAVALEGDVQPAILDCMLGVILPQGRARHSFGGEAWGIRSTGAATSSGDVNILHREPRPLSSEDVDWSGIPGGWCGVAVLPDGVVELACDRVGLRDLYYTRFNSVWYFSTVIRAFYCIPGWQTGTDQARVCEYMAYRRVAGCHTLYCNVDRVLPGEVLRWSRASRQVVPRCYWRYHWQPGDIRTRGTAVAKLLQVLDRTISRHADESLRPFLMLSGGIDSAGIMASLKQQHLDCPAKTLIPDDAGYSEGGRVGEIERALQMSTERIHVDAASLFRHLDDAHEVLEQPVVHTIALQHMEIYEAAASAGHRAFLTGEGADTLFGYDRFARYFLIWRCWQSRLRPVFRLLAGLLGKANVWHALTATDWSDHLVRSRAMFPDEALRPLMLQWVSPHGTRQDMLQASGDTSAAGRLELASRYYFETFIQGCRIFVALGRAAGLEPILPYTGTALRDFAFALPVNLKFRWLCGKYILKKANVGRLPSGIIWGRKHSGEQPLGKWLREHEGLRRKVEACYAGDALVSEFMDVSVLEPIVRDHMHGTADHSVLLWQVLSLETWLRVVQRCNHGL